MELTVPYSPLYNFVKDELPECTYALGDVDKDGSVGTKDAEKLQKYLVNAAKIDGSDAVLADINHDGKVNVFDQIALKRMN